MNRLLLLLLLLTPLFSVAQTDVANYDIEVVLNTQDKTLLGNQHVRWKNTSSDAVSTLQFHLYLNAFRDNKSTFMKGHLGSKAITDTLTKKDDGWGNIYITSMQTAKGENLLSTLRFIQPDDGNPHDRTVAEVKLSRPVLPNETIELLMQFKAQLPKIVHRTGYARDDFYLIAQWFPKLGVYEPAGTRYASKGQWNTHQFHVNTEFYANFGTYNVRITAPDNLKVGATGKLQSERKLPKNLKEWHFMAQNVHDFAWTASPSYQIVHRKWKGVDIQLFIQPEHRQHAGRYLDAAEKSLSAFEKIMGKYPYTTLTLVDPPLSGAGAGGMEYPTFITLGSYWGLGKWAKLPEIVTIHEFGHQYFQGMLASNEFEESWLDEGLNQYLQARIVDKAYGGQFAILGNHVSDIAINRSSYVGMENPTVTPIFNKAWLYPSGTYQIMTYTKTATWMQTLENYLGKPVMDEILRTYFEQWKFKHPSGKDFIDVVRKVVAKHKPTFNVDNFFDQVLYNSPACDYAITHLKNSGRKEPAYGEFTIQRLAEMQMPTDILVVFSDKTKKLIKWNGEEKTRTFTFLKKIDYVIADPLRKNLMDINRINNSQTTSIGKAVYTKYSLKMLFWLQTFWQLLASL